MWLQAGKQERHTSSKEIQEHTVTFTKVVHSPFSLFFGFVYGSVTCGTAALNAFKEQNKVKSTKCVLYLPSK